MTKVYIANNNSPFPGRYVDLETLIKQRDQAYEDYCDYLEQYGDNDQDTLACEAEYIALDRLIEEAELIEEAR
jgi:hypothetical protein